MMNGAHPAGTTGRVKVMFPSEVCALFFNANVLRKTLLVRSTGEDSVFRYAHLREREPTKDSQRSKLPGSPGEVVQLIVIGLEE